mmetsp:Transcript_88488/g.239869  ORF Transcript_88488/g.239869 Transcript_88488/m.239869 type:complete len:401 (-) Transcript_88488:212-1414(-)
MGAGVQALGHRRQLEQGPRGRPALRLLLQYPVHHVAHARAELLGQGFGAAVDNLQDGGGNVIAEEGLDQADHLVQHDSQRPDVDLAVVPLVRAHLRRQERRGAHELRRLLQSVLHDFGNAEVPQLHVADAREKDVLALDVPVHDPPFVDVSQREQALSEHAHGFPLRVGLGAGPQVRGQVAPVRVLEDDVQGAAVLKEVEVRDDVRVGQPPQHLHLLLGRLRVRTSRRGHSLDHPVRGTGTPEVSHQDRFARGAAAQMPHALEVRHARGGWIAVHDGGPGSRQAALHHVEAEQVGGGGPRLRLLCQGLRQHQTQLVTRARGQRRRVAPDDLHDEGGDVAGGEGQGERDHLVQHDAHGPDIHFLTVWQVLADLGRHIIGSPYRRAEDGRRRLLDLRYTEVR